MGKARFAWLAAIVALSTVGGCTSLLGDFGATGGGGDASMESEGGGDGMMDETSGDSASSSSSGGDSGRSDADSGKTGDADGSTGCNAGALLCSGVCVPNDVHDCGHCGHDCTTLPHVGHPGGVTCDTATGTCTVPASACASGYAHCTSNPDDGCETAVDTSNRCGTCTTVCSGGTPVCAQAPADAGVAYECASGCPAGTPTYCPADAGGTCVNTTNDPLNCGSCGNACTTSVTNATASCSASNCGYTCDSGYTACAAGCWNTSSDAQHCGASCSACPAPANATPSCSGGTCAWACNGGYTQCNGACADLQTDGNNCNACGRSCLGGSCVGGVCQPVVFVASTLTSSIEDFATDGNIVVWADGGDTTVDEVATLGAASKIQLASQPGPTPRGIALSTSGNGNVSWIEYDSTSPGFTRLWIAQAGVAGSAAEQGVPQGGVTNGLVYDPNGSTVYTLLQSTTTVALMAATAKGGTWTTLKSLSSAQSSFDLAYGAGFLVFGDVTNGNVVQYQVVGGTVTTLTAQPTVYHVAADGSYAYWIASSSQALLDRAPLGGTTVSAVSSVAGAPITTDGVNVYFLSGTSLQYVPVAGGSVRTLTTSINPGHIRYAGGAVYYDNAGAIYRVKTP
jgi:hypothetical protein